MQFKILAEGDVLQVQAENRLTHQAFSPVKEPLGAQLGTSVYGRKVLLDLSQTDYIDSSAVGWLLSVHKKCREAGGKLVLHSVTPMVQQILRMMRLEQVLAIAPDVKQAHDLLTEEAPA